MELRMSLKERDRLKVMVELDEGRLRQKAAARRLGLSVRQVKRILQRYRAEGDAGLVHKARGRRSNRKTAEPLRRRVLACLRRDYADFGPTLAAEKLSERDGLGVSHETVRQWMMAEGLWQGRPRREPHRQWRARRECFGELVQMDGSPHDWFEGRGSETVVLLTLIDDATGRRMQRFYEYEGTEPALDLLGRWLRKYGRMGALYADKAGHLVVNRPPNAEEARSGREAETQVGRALRELQIDFIAAHSPQAKGRWSGRTRWTRTGWSRSCGWRGSPRSRRPTGSWRNSTRRSATASSRWRRPRGLTPTGGSWGWTWGPF